jgi:hypothetical protein
LLTRLWAASNARQSPFTERQILPQLPHSEQFTQRRLSGLTSTKLPEERDEDVRLQLVENPSRGLQRRDVRSPDGVVPEQNPNCASSTRRLLRRLLVDGEVAVLDTLELLEAENSEARVERTGTAVRLVVRVRTQGEQVLERVRVRASAARSSMPRRSSR